MALYLYLTYTMFLWNRKTHGCYSPFTSEKAEAQEGTECPRSYSFRVAELTFAARFLVSKSGSFL